MWCSPITMDHHVVVTLYVPLVINLKDLIIEFYFFSAEQGYSEAQLKECLEEYAALNVWQIHDRTFDIRFIDA